MALKDLDTFFDPELKLPIRGKVYSIPAPLWEEEKRLRAIVGDTGVPPVEQIDDALRVLGAKPLTDKVTITDPESGEPTEVELPNGDWAGGAFSEMVADDIPWPMILHAGRTAICHYGFNPDAAEIHWQMSHLARLVDLDKVGEMLAQLKK